MKKTQGVKKISSKRPTAADLARLLPELTAAGVIVFDEDTLSEYSSDWTKMPGKAAAVAFPRSVEDVRILLSTCNKRGIPVVPSGGRTGLAGGATAVPGSLALSLSKMTKIHPVDLLSRTVRVEAGAITEAVHEHCLKSGLIWPIDLASKGSCTVGGNLSTNAGGVRVVRYGMARRWVVAAKAVTIEGEFIELCGGLEKDNVGYSLLQLLVGSEGTLAVIVEATLKLAPIPDSNNKQVFLFSVSSLSQVYEIFHGVRQRKLDVGAFEFFSDRCFEAVELQAGKTNPLGNRGKFYVLLEANSEGDCSDWLSELVDRGVVLDGIRANSEAQAQALWSIRESITESLGRTARLRKFDLSLPFHRQAEFLERMESIADEERWGIELYFFGHFGDGSPHINVLKPASVSEAMFDLDADRFEKELIQAVLQFGGSLSAEHGVGLLRRQWLEMRRSEPEKKLYRAIKRAFDPEGLLNPGKILFEK